MTHLNTYRYILTFFIDEIVTIWRGDSDHRYCKVVSLFEMSNGNKVMAMLFLGNNLLIYYFDGIWKLKADSLKNNDLKPRYIK